MPYVSIAMYFFKVFYFYVLIAIFFYLEIFFKQSTTTFVKRKEVLAILNKYAAFIAYFKTEGKLAKL